MCSGRSSYHHSRVMEWLLMCCRYSPFLISPVQSGHHGFNQAGAVTCHPSMSRDGPRVTCVGMCSRGVARPFV
eukprot:scaffold180710_cov36-Tisochrysis_lutea.AAC.4